MVFASVIPAFLGCVGHGCDQDCVGGRRDKVEGPLVQQGWVYSLCIAHQPLHQPHPSLAQALTQPTGGGYARRGGPAGLLI